MRCEREFSRWWRVIMSVSVLNRIRYSHVWSVENSFSATPSADKGADRPMSVMRGHRAPTISSDVLPVDQLAVPGKEPAAVFGRQAVDDPQQVFAGLLDRKQLFGRHVGLERRRQAGVGRARVQGGDDGILVASGQLDAGGSHDLVQRCLGRAVGIPAAKTVVADGSYARRDDGEYGLAFAPHQGTQRPEQQRRAERVDGEYLFQRGQIQVLEFLLRAEAFTVQDAGGVDHQRQPDAARLQVACQRLDPAGFGHVQGKDRQSIAVKRGQGFGAAGIAAGCDHAEFGVVLQQRLYQTEAYAAAGALHQYCRANRKGCESAREVGHWKSRMN